MPVPERDCGGNELVSLIMQYTHDPVQTPSSPRKLRRNQQRRHFFFMGGDDPLMASSD